jgi:hypothetical protein
VGDSFTVTTVSTLHNRTMNIAQTMWPAQTLRCFRDETSLGHVTRFRDFLQPRQCLETGRDPYNSVKVISFPSTLYSICNPLKPEINLDNI